MRAAFISAFGNPTDVVTVGDLPDPLVGPDVVQVRMAHAGVNPVDWKIVAGGLRGAIPCHFPLVPGWDVAGVVTAVGPAVTTVAVGDTVAAYNRQDQIQIGTFAELTAVNERAVARLPSGVTTEQAGALPLAGLTAAQLLDAVQVADGDVVFVSGAAGGVGTFATQLAQIRGARVIGSAGATNLALLAERGVAPVDYQGDLVAGVRALAPDGVDVVVDLVGGQSLAATPELLKPGGRVTTSVDAGALVALVDRYGYGGHYVFVRPDATMLARLLALVADGRLHVPIAGRYPLHETAAALEESKAGHVTGKLVIHP